MTRIMLTLAATFLAGTALAQTTPRNTTPGATSNAPMPGVSPSTGVAPGTGVVNRNTGTAAASGDSNQTVATTNANAPQPARGANSFSQGEAQRRIGAAGFQGVGALTKDDGGVWRGTATKDGRSVGVWLDYKGNIGQDGGMGQFTSTPGSTVGNPPGTTAGRATDRALGTNMTGTNPAANAPDGTPGNPAGTAAGRAMDRTLGTNSTGTNPAGSSAVTPR